MEILPPQCVNVQLLRQNKSSSSPLTIALCCAVRGLMNFRINVMRYISFNCSEASLNGGGGTGQLPSNPTSLGGSFLESWKRKSTLTKSRYCNYRHRRNIRGRRLWRKVTVEEEWMSRGRSGKKRKEKKGGHNCDVSAINTKTKS